MTSEVPRPVCLIPARGGSRRFPRKNIALLRGRPLLAWAIEAARESKLFDDVWVSTDDAEIAAIARDHGAVVHDRPEALAGDTATIAQVGVDFLDWLAARGRAAETICIVLPTAALMRADDLRGAWDLFLAREAEYGIAVTTYLESPFWALHEVAGGYYDLFFGDQYARATQALPAVRVDAGYFYFVRASSLRRERKLYGPRLVGYPIPRARAIDIDEPEHLVIAEALLAAMESGKDAAR
jgi:N-acylneuraminate cytidylyltransferase